MTNQERAAKFYAEGKISAWNSRGQYVRILIHSTWWPLTARLVAELEG
jgi:hypothetical protein